MPWQKTQNRLYSRRPSATSFGDVYGLVSLVCAHMAQGTSSSAAQHGIISTMVRPTRVSIILLIAGLAAGLAWLTAQQSGASDPAYASQPGGTPEEKLWQVL